jgi:DNA-binding LacI/PurR family transcriptional regulator
MRTNSTVTIRDVAREAGVSKTTVAHVLRDSPDYRVHEGTRARVLDAANRLGYRRNALAAALSSGRLDTIGVLMPLDHAEEISIYFKDMALAIAVEAAEAGLRMTLVPYRAGSGRITSPREVADQRVDGVLTVSVHDPAFIESLYAANIPVVEIGGAIGGRSVRPDNAGGAGQAVEHLVSLGHRRIAHYRGRPNNATADQRAAGFRTACRTHGLSEADTPVLTSEEIGDALAAPPNRRPTAFFAFNDGYAAHLYDLCTVHGLSVPKDISIVGFDDSVVAETVRPRMTAIHNPLRAQAAEAIRLLRACWIPEEAIEAGDRVAVLVPTRLIARDSTAPPAT